MPKIKPVNLKEICASYVKEMGKKSILQTLPVIKNSGSITNPLVMDAKANLTRINVKKQIDEIKYKAFNEAIFDELANQMAIVQMKNRNSINPYKDSNFEEAKSRLKPFYEYINPSFRADVFEAKNSTTFFNSIKDNAVELLSPEFSLYEIINKIETSGETPELLREWKKFKNHEVIQGIFDALTPKSTLPEVLKLEEDVKNLGVSNVNFSDDLKQAKLVKEAFNNLVNRNIPLPKSIVISPILPSNIGGRTISNIKHIYLPTSQEDEYGLGMNSNIDKILKNIDIFKDAPKEYQEKFLEHIRHYSTSKAPLQKIYHEIGHLFEQLSYNLTQEELATAKEISEYAASVKSGIEIVPEMFVVLMDGQKLTEKQMALYLKLGGIVPQA